MGVAEDHTLAFSSIVVHGYLYAWASACGCPPIQHRRPRKGRPHHAYSWPSQSNVTGVAEGDSDTGIACTRCWDMQGFLP